MKNISKYNLFKIGYVFFPFISFLLVLRDYKASWFKNALWLFIIFFGFSMSFIETIDAYAYKYIFETYINYNNIDSIIDVFDSSKTGRVDFATPLINYSLNYFTSNYHVLFGVYAVIFGFFYSRNIDFILKRSNNNSLKSIIGLIVFLSFYIGFWNINGFRFWTATHIFVYGLIKYIYLRKKFKGVSFMLLALMFHISFFLPLVIFLIYKHIPKLNKFYLLIIVALTLYNPISDLKFIENRMLKYAYNEQLEGKVELYTSDEVVVKSGSSSHKTDPFKVFSGLLIKGMILSLAWSLASKLTYLRKEEAEMFSYGLTLTLTGAVLSFIPSVGRFSVVGLFLLLYAIIIILINNNFLYQKRKLLSNTGYLCAILILMTNIWIFYTFSIHTILGNYFTILVDSTEVFYSLGDLLFDIYK